MIRKSTLQFLKDLKKNNKRDWFNVNKLRYKDALMDFEQLTGRLIEGIQVFEPGIIGLPVKDCIFRIYRDIRFSKDKKPYKEHFGSHIAVGGRKSPGPGYYIHLEPGTAFLAGGVYAPDKAMLSAIRQEIDYCREEFLEIVQSEDFIKYFGSLQGETLKKAPYGYSVDHPMIKYLRHKSFIMVHPFDEKISLNKDFVPYCLKVFQHMVPLNRFLARAVS